MKVEIFNKTLSMTIHGLSGVAVNKNYAGTAFKLMDRMWQIVKSNNLKNKGLNVWVYDIHENIFAGVELNDIPDQDFGLEQKNITLLKYAYFKHIGPFHQIRQSVQWMTEELKGMSLVTCLPYIEIYGHPTSDETKQETELIYCIK